jgi:hypothetical protein
MFTTVKYILITAFRDLLFAGVAMLLLLSIGVSYFLGGTSLIEEDVARLVFSAGSSRLVLDIGLIVFVCFHVRTSFQNKEIDLLLTRPITRFGFIFSYWMGFAIVSLILVASLSLLLKGIYHVKWAYICYWGMGMFCELALMIAFCIFASLILRSAVSSVLLSMGFYVISRMMGFFLYIVDGENKLSIDTVNSLNDVFGLILYFVSSIIPRLDLMAQSKWLVYKQEETVRVLGGFLPETYLFIPQTLIYVPFILLMAYYDFRRKQF